MADGAAISTVIDVATSDNITAELGLTMTSTQKSLLDSCPIWTDPDRELLYAFSFWVEGVSQSIFAIVGVLGNVASCFILNKRSMRITFNLLLVTLAVFDSWYLFGALLESFRSAFGLGTDTHVLLFPYFLYPLHQAAMAGSIFMTVAIAVERYNAVHHPVDFSQTMNDGNAMRRRLLKYILPVFLLSLAFTVPKFFEAQIAYRDISEITAAGENVTRSRPFVAITTMRMNHIYSGYNNWSRLIVLGVIPFALLVFFNARIYRGIRQRSGRRRCRQERSSSAAPAAATAASAAAGASAVARRTTTANMPVASPQPSSSGNRIISFANVSTNNKDQQQDKDGEEQASETLLVPPESRDDETGEAAESRIWTPASSGKGGGGRGGVRKSLCSVRRKRMRSKRQADESPMESGDGDGGGGGGDSEDGLRSASVVSERCRKARKTIMLPKSFCRSRDKGRRNDSPERTSTHSMTSQARNGGNSNSSSSRKMDNHLAMIFMGIVLIFLVCHFPRVLLAFHEIANIHQYAECQKNGQNPVSVGYLITNIMSHFLLVFNSATNMIVYCVMSPKFRGECLSTWIRWRKRFRGAAPAAATASAAAETVNCTVATRM